MGTLFFHGYRTEGDAATPIPQWSHPFSTMLGFVQGQAFALCGAIDSIVLMN